MKTKPKYFVVDFETTGTDLKNDFPIEIGGLFLDSNFVISSSVESFIGYDEARYGQMIDLETMSWLKNEAYEIHKISPKEYMKNAVHVRDIAIDLTWRCKDEAVIIISDCGNFEFAMMKRLYNHAWAKFPFHYCAWDTSLLFESVGMTDPEPEHRAFRDATIIYKSLMEALSRAGGKK